MRVFIPILLILFLVPSPSHLETLRRYLLRSGVSPATVQRFFKTVEFNKAVALKNVTHRERVENYSYAFTPGSVEKIKAFMKRHRKVLKCSCKRYGVYPSITASILFLESGFNPERAKKFHVATVFYTLYLMGNEKFVRRVTRNPSPGLMKKLRRRSLWAKKELAILLSRIENPLSLYGSWAGAFGLCQFIPSSYVHYAVDGDGDGKIDPFDPDDAIMSVANFLKMNGWKKNMTEQEMERVIFRFNHSVPYCKAVIRLHKILARNSA